MTRVRKACPIREGGRRGRDKETRRPIRVGRATGLVREAAPTACCHCGAVACIVGRTAAVSLLRGCASDLVTAVRRRLALSYRGRCEIKGLP